MLAAARELHWLPNRLDKYPCHQLISWVIIYSSYTGEITYYQLYFINITADASNITNIDIIYLQSINLWLTVTFDENEEIMKIENMRFLIKHF